METPETTPAAEETPPALPQQTGPASVVDVAPEHVGRPCYLCGDEPNTAPIEAGDQVVVVPTDQGDLLQHPLCFYVQRCAQLEAALAVTGKRAEAAEVRAVQASNALAATHRTLCSVLAKTGRVTFWPHNFERAAKAGWKIDTIKGPDDSTAISLRGSSIELVR